MTDVYLRKTTQNNPSLGYIFIPIVRLKSIANIKFLYYKCKEKNEFVRNLTVKLMQGADILI